MAEKAFGFGRSNKYAALNKDTATPVVTTRLVELVGKEVEAIIEKLRKEVNSTSGSIDPDNGLYKVKPPAQEIRKLCTYRAIRDAIILFEPSFKKLPYAMSDELDPLDSFLKTVCRYSTEATFIRSCFGILNRNYSKVEDRWLRFGIKEEDIDDVEKAYLALREINRTEANELKGAASMTRENLAKRINFFSEERAKWLRDTHVLAQIVTLSVTDLPPSKIVETEEKMKQDSNEDRRKSFIFALNEHKIFLVEQYYKEPTKFKLSENVSRKK